MTNYNPDTDVIQVPNWDNHIRHFFSDHHIKMMKWFCDLGKYEDVKKYSSKIYARLIAPKGQKRMPPEGWPAPKIETFHNWMKNDTPKSSPNNQINT